MTEESIRNAIDLACTKEPRDWTQAEKDYIIHSAYEGNGHNPTFQDERIFWLESNCSDGCWTEANQNFLHSL